MYKSTYRNSILCSIFIISSCATTESVVNQSMTLLSMSKPDDPKLKATVLIIGRGADEFTVCNGVHIGKGQILTAGHCLSSLEEGYDVFIPEAIVEEAPYTRVTLRAVEAAKARLQSGFKVDLKQGTVRNDLAKLELSHDWRGVLGSVPLVKDKTPYPKVESLAWDQSFLAVPSFGMSLTGVRIDHSGPQRGLFILSDAVHFVGPLKVGPGLLLSLNEGTHIHRGVSGSGIYQLIDGREVLVAIASYFVADLRLLVGSDLRQLDASKL